MDAATAAAMTGTGQQPLPCALCGACGDKLFAMSGIKEGFNAIRSGGVAAPGECLKCPKCKSASAKNGSHGSQLYRQNLWRLLSYLASGEAPADAGFLRSYLPFPPAAALLPLPLEGAALPNHRRGSLAARRTEPAGSSIQTGPSSSTDRFLEELLAGGEELLASGYPSTALPFHLDLASGLLEQPDGRGELDRSDDGQGQSQVDDAEMHEASSAPASPGSAYVSEELMLGPEDGDDSENQEMQIPPRTKDDEIQELQARVLALEADLQSQREATCAAEARAAAAEASAAGPSAPPAQQAASLQATEAVEQLLQNLKIGGPSAIQAALDHWGPLRD